jgi:hypothetical protein
MTEALHSSKTRFLTRATWSNIPEDGILHIHRSENLKSYKGILSFMLLKSHTTPFTEGYFIQNCLIETLKVAFSHKRGLKIIYFITVICSLLILDRVCI